MKRFEKLVLLGVCLVIALSTAAVAGNTSKLGTAGALELLIPDGARGTALGGASLTTITGIEAIYWNPAGLPLFQGKVDAMFSHMNYIAETSIDYGAAAVNISGLGTIALSIKSLSFGNIPITTEDFPEGTGSTFSPAYTVVGLSYGNQLTDRISVGTTVKLINESIINTSATGFALDAGVLYAFGDASSLPGLKFGVALKNLGPNMQFDGTDLERSVVPPGSPIGTAPRPLKFTAQSFELPSTLEMGLSYDYHLGETNRLTAATLFENNNFGADQYRFGLEYSFQETFFLRGGYVSAPDQASTVDYVFGPTAGAGVNLSMGGMILAVDYAYRATDTFKGTNTIAVRLTF